MQSIAAEELDRSIMLNNLWGKPEIRAALQELRERIVYREAREANSDYLRGYRDGLASREENGNG